MPGTVYAESSCRRTAATRAAALAMLVGRYLAAPIVGIADDPGVSA